MAATTTTSLTDLPAEVLAAVAARLDSTKDFESLIWRTCRSLRRCLSPDQQLRASAAVAVAERGGAALLGPCERGDLPLVQLLIDCGHLKKYDERLPAASKAAARNGHADVMRALIEGGYIYAASSEALGAAAGAGHVAMVRMLLDEGGLAVDGGDAATDALGYAAEAGNAEICKMLLEAGAEAEGTDGFYLPLARAVKGGHDAVVDLLVDAGVTLKDLCIIARDYDDEELVQLARQEMVRHRQRLAQRRGGGRAGAAGRQEQGPRRGAGRGRGRA